MDVTSSDNEITLNGLYEEVLLNMTLHCDLLIRLQVYYKTQLSVMTTLYQNKILVNGINGGQGL